VLADVERGVWTPAKPPPPSPSDAPLFGDFADEWWKRRKGQLAPKTQADYRWRLEVHLPPEFEDVPLDAITVDAIDRYVSKKLAQALSPRSTNMGVTILGAILESAVDRELIDRNPARGRNRRARERKPSRSYLESAEQIEALLKAAGNLDAKAQEDKRHVHRKAMLATLTFAGLRRNEMLALRWRDVDLANGWLAVRESKTEAGVRKVKIRGALRDKLVAIKPTDSDQDAYVFPSRTGGRISPENFRNRILATAIERAGGELAKRDLPPLPELVTSAQLAQDLRQRALRGRRGPRRRHGRTGPHRPRSGPAHLPPGDAQRREREGEARRAGRRWLSAVRGSQVSGEGQGRLGRSRALHGPLREVFSGSGP
jgi:integrase